MTSSASQKPSVAWPMPRAGETSAGTAVAPGELLNGKYRIEALIAEGGMGVVKRATHLDLDCPVAIKLIRPEHAQNEDVVDRLLAEARIAASLRSKHVNRVLDVGRTDAGLPYLVLEYLQGSDLAGYLARRGRLPPNEAVDYVLQACEALAEAHAVGIVHRDLKPENLFLSEDADGAFSLKVLDFGISKAPPARRGGRTLTSPFEIMGSPTYMSPEQILAATVDSRSDIWTLGVVLYELCTGELLFNADSVTDTFGKILDAPAPLATFDEVTGGSELGAVVAKCLRRNPEERYQNVVELARALGPFGDDALQPARVAKVAAAARARLIAASTDGASQPTLVTPVALTSEVDIDVGLCTDSPARSAWRRWALVGAAAAGLFGGVAFAARRPAAVPASVAVPPVPARALPSAAAVDEPPEVVEAATFSVPAPTLPRAAAPAATPVTAWVSPRHWLPKPVRVPATPPPSAPSTRPIPSVVPTAKPVEPPPEPAPSNKDAATDAWNPKSFGGRR
jgi:serine/threonine protein kinase